MLAIIQIKRTLPRTNLKYLPFLLGKQQSAQSKYRQKRIIYAAHYTFITILIQQYLYT